MRQRKIEQILKVRFWACHYIDKSSLIASSLQSGKSCVFNLPKDGKCYFDDRKCDAVKFQLKEDRSL